MYSYAYNSSKAAKYYVEEVNKAKDDAIKPPTRYFLSLRSCRGTFGRELDAKHVFDTKGRAKERKSEEREEWKIMMLQITSEKNGAEHNRSASDPSHKDRHSEDVKNIVDGSLRKEFCRPEHRGLYRPEHSLKNYALSIIYLSLTLQASIYPETARTAIASPLVTDLSNLGPIFRSENSRFMLYY